LKSAKFNSLKVVVFLLYFYFREISQTDLKSALVNIDSKLEESKDVLDSFVSSAFRESGQEYMDKPTILKNLRKSCLGHLS